MAALTKAAVRRHVEELGGEFNDLHDRRTPRPERVDEVEVCAPDGYVWTGNGCHSYVEQAAAGEPVDWSDVYRFVSYGIERCMDTLCEWCTNPEAT